MSTYCPTESKYYRPPPLVIPLLMSGRVCYQQEVYVAQRKSTSLLAWTFPVRIRELADCVLVYGVQWGLPARGQHLLPCAGAI